LLALISLMTVLAAQASVARAQPLETGVSYVWNEDPANFAHVKSAGAELTHTWINWGLVAPELKPDSWDPTDPADTHYRWGNMDAWVTNAVAAGLTPVLQIYGAPRWAQSCAGADFYSAAPCGIDSKAMADFATAAARRYSGTFQGLPRVRYWQAQNEPNLSLFYTPQFEGSRPVSPDSYRRLLNDFYPAIKAVNPSNLVLAAGLAPIGRPGAAVPPLRFTQMLLCMSGGKKPKPRGGSCGGGVKFDIFDMHPYTTGGPTHAGKGGDVQIGNLEDLQTLLAAADRAGRIDGVYKRTPLWITEMSWDTKPPDPGGLPMATACRWAVEAMYKAWSAGISHFFWFTIRDDPPGGAFNETFQSGLFLRGDSPAQDRPKKLLSAFRFPFVAYSGPKGFSFWGRSPTSTPGKVTIQIKDGGWRTVATRRANGSGIFNGDINGEYGRDRRGTVRARFGKELSVPFSLKPVKNFYQPPFG
jgi:hypothetical protein